jgi:hypothetical protein
VTREQRIERAGRFADTQIDRCFARNENAIRRRAVFGVESRISRRHARLSQGG